MIEMTGYSVLMSVYAKEKPEFFRAALKSIVQQSLKPSQIVLICDGPLPEDLNDVVREAEAAGLVETLRLAENVGLGKALNEGLRYCRYEYIARMDTDDIARTDRCEKQLLYMIENDLAACSGWLEEFWNNPGDMQVIKKLPEKHEALRAYAKRRNPMNHPAVMARKTEIQRAGGYREMPYFEDYDLWVRMLENGCRIGNMPETLVDMRIGNGMYGRRGGLAYCGYIRRFYKSLKERGFIGNLTYIENVLMRCGVSLLPSSMRGKLYRKMLRSRSKGRR